MNASAPKQQSPTIADVASVGPKRPAPQHLYRPLRNGRFRNSPPLPAIEVNVDPNDFMNRRNSGTDALGKFRRKTFLGHRLYYSNDYWAWYIPSVMTLFIVIGNMAIGWAVIGWASFIAVIALVTTGFTASYLVTCTDPGIYPRLRPGEVDPLARYEGLIFCRVCQMRRPPRTSHCYQCNVCVLEHDHHCGVIGGCVGVRSLRWFTLFLVCQSTACCIGVYWLGYFFTSTVYVLEQKHSENGTSSTTQPSTTPLPSYLADLHIRRFRSTRNPLHMNQDVSDLVGLRHVAAVFMLLIDLVVIALVGVLAVMYTYLTLSSTTRRESQKQETSCRICCQPRKMFDNIIRTALPPKSLLEEESDEALSSVDVLVEATTESDRLV